MKAAVLADVEKIVIEERDIPQIKDGQALIKVKYCGICGTEGHMLKGQFP